MRIKMKEKTKFKDLSGWLKVGIVGGIFTSVIYSILILVEIFINLFG